jgi:integrase
MALYKRGKVWWYSFEFQGRRMQASTGHRNRTAALRVEAKRKTDLLNGRAGFAPKKAPPRFEEGVKTFLAWSKERHRPKTHALHEMNCETLKRFFAGKWLDVVTPEMVEEFRQLRAHEARKNAKDGSTVAPATVNRALSTLRLLFNVLGFKSPVSKGMFGKEPEGTRVVTPAEELKYFREASQPLHDIATVILHTGMRPEEVFRMECRNVDLQRRTIFNPWGKTKAAQRLMPVDHAVHDILKRRTEGAKGRFVFCSPEGPGRAENPDRAVGSVRKAHDAALERAAVGHFRLYDLRHTFATRAAQAGVDVLTLAALLGHTSVQMTMRYVHPTDQHKKSAAEKFEAYNAELLVAALKKEHGVVTVSATIV